MKILVTTIYIVICTVSGHAPLYRTLFVTPNPIRVINRVWTSAIAVQVSCHSINATSACQQRESNEHCSIS